MMKPHLTQKELKELIRLDNKTGKFYSRRTGKLLNRVDKTRPGYYCERLHIGGHRYTVSKLIIYYKTGEWSDKTVCKWPTVKTCKDVTAEMIMEYLTCDVETGDIFYKDIPVPLKIFENHKRYQMIHAFGVSLYVHRVIYTLMTGELVPEDRQIDHINRMQWDNRWANIRLVTTSEQALNRGKRRRNKTANEMPGKLAILKRITYNPETGEVINKHNKTVGWIRGTKRCVNVFVGNKNYEIQVDRLAIYLNTGRWPTGWIRHLNGDLLDDRLINLKEYDEPWWGIELNNTLTKPSPCTEKQIGTSNNTNKTPPHCSSQACG